MRDSLNQYLTDKTYISGNNMANLNDSDYYNAMKSYLALGPLCLLCKYGPDSQFGWGTSEGHYIVVKGMFESGLYDINYNPIYACLINDSYQNNCRERVIYLSNLHTYNNNKYGYGVFPIQ